MKLMLCWEERSSHSSVRNWPVASTSGQKERLRNNRRTVAGSGRPDGAGGPFGAVAPMRCQLEPDQLFDPRVTAGHPLLEAYPRLPVKHLAHPSVVGVPPAYALRTRHVLLSHLDAGRARRHIGQPVD